jgi:hypothetical protein
MGRSAVAVGLVLAVSAALVLAVMLWPAAHAPATGDDDDSVREGAVTVKTRPDVRPPSGALKAARARADKLTDGGVPWAQNDPRVLAQFGWGSGKNQLGRHRPREGNPEGPMSFTLDRSGNAWVLDQVNGRVVKLDEHGNPIGTQLLTVQAAQDLTVAKNGNALVMDRLVDKTVAVMGPDGKSLGELAIAGRGVPETGKVTGVFTDGDSVYVEREHGDLVRVGDTSGKTDPNRPEIPGRPTRDGQSYVSAQITDGAHGRVAVTEIDRSSNEHKFTREVPFGMPVLMILLLDTDQSGLIYLAAEGERPGATSTAPVIPVVDLLCLDPVDGRPLGRAETAANTSADETFREMTVQDSGGVVYLYRSESGAELRRLDCR